VCVCVGVGVGVRVWVCVGVHACACACAYECVHMSVCGRCWYVYVCSRGEGMLYSHIVHLPGDRI